VPAEQYAAAWLRAFLERGSGLEFDEPQTTRVAALAERKLSDLLDVAGEAALANGRMQVQRHDLPITKGLRAVMGEAEALIGEAELQPLLEFLEEVPMPARLDELVQKEIPHLMAALLLLTSRVIDILEPKDVSPQERLDRLLRGPSIQPTPWEVEPATRVLDMTL